MSMPRRVLHGNLNLTNLPAVIRGFYAARKSGILHLSSHQSSRRIFFREGRIVLVESDAETDRFGEELVRTGRLQRADLNSALQRATRERTSLGSALVNMKRLTVEEVKDAERRRMNDIVCSLLALTSGEFRFEEVENPVEEGAAVEIPAEQVILDGVRRIADVAVLRSLVGDLRATLRPTESSALPLFKIKMTPAERGLLEATRVRRAFNTEQLLAGSRVSELDALRAVCALIAIGLVEAEGTTAPRLETLDESETPRGQAVATTAPKSKSIPRRIGRFEIQRLLGKGSMGEVFRARDPESDRIVAVKLLRSAAALAPAALEEFLKRFQEGTEASRQLYHPAIVAIWETGLTGERCPFLVSEYVQGTTLRDLLSSGSLAVKHALDLADQILDGLAQAHSRGIVHRHIEPANVLVTADGRAKIKDFGLPRITGFELGGRRAYLSPEQIGKGVIDVRSDVFSAGVVCYRMLTGALPFPEESSTTVVRALRSSERPAPLERLNPDVPPPLSAVVLRCLASHPDERFANAGELREALRSLAGPPPRLARSPPTTTVVVPTDHADQAPADVEKHPPVPLGRVPRREVAPAEPALGVIEERVVREEPALHPESSIVRLESRESGRKRQRIAAPRRRRLTVTWVAAGMVIVSLLAGALWILLAREEPLGLPSPPASDVTTTPIPLSPPSEEVLVALLGGPSDETLLAEASSALERGDLQGSRSILMGLLDRVPDFPGARDLLGRIERAEEERRRAADRRRRAAEKKPEPEAVVDEPNQAVLFSEAESALARGELAVSKTKLEALLKINPVFSGAAELMKTVERRIWTSTLPRSYSARHNHRLGSCEGTLVLTATGLGFRSSDHEWGWAFDELVSMERPDAVSFNFVTGERDLLGILNNKRFKFELREAFSDYDWRFFRESVEDRE